MSEQAATPPSRRSGGRHRAHLDGVGVLAFVLGVCALAYGVVLRAWLLGHLPLTSDEAVVGLAARAALHGHFSAFYWGQHYGGGETYAVAGVLGALNGGPAGLNATAAALALVAAVLVGVAVRSVTADGRLGLLAGGAAWVWSYAVVWNSVRENGFRQLVLCAGLAMLLLALRIWRGGAQVWVYAALGLAAGIGWWASPELVYLAVPTAVVLVAAWDRLFDPTARRAPWRLGPLGVAVAGAVVGSLPWVYANVGNGFASLRPGALPSTPGQGFAYRLGVFFRDMLPMQLGVRTVPGGAWVGGPTVGQVLYGLLAAGLVAAVGWALWSARRGRSAAPLLAAGLAIVAFPLLYAAVPSSGYWVDGRYGVLLPALVVVVVAIAPAGRRPSTAGHARRRSAGVRAASFGRGTPTRRTLAVLTGCAALVGAGALTMAAGQAGGVPARPTAFWSGWRDPDAAARAVDAALVAHHLHDAYGDYWTAYALDFLAPGTVTISPSPADVVRSAALASAVARAKDPAWLFVAPGRAATAAAAFANPERGPGGFTEGQFEGLLTHLGVGYRVVHLGVLDAVLPDRRVPLPAPLG